MLYLTQEERDEVYKKASDAAFSEMNGQVTCEFHDINDTADWTRSVLNAYKAAKGVISESNRFYIDRGEKGAPTSSKPFLSPSEDLDLIVASAYSALLDGMDIGEFHPTSKNGARLIPLIKASGVVSLITHASTELEYAETGDERPKDVNVSL